MRTKYYIYSCDKCGFTLHEQIETLPDGWCLLLISVSEMKPNKWEHRMHMCTSCHKGVVEYVNPLSPNEGLPVTEEIPTI